MLLLSLTTNLSKQHFIQKARFILTLQLTATTQATQAPAPLTIIASTIALHRHRWTWTPMRNRLLNSHKTHHHSNRRRQRLRQQQIRQQMDRHRKLSAIVSAEIEVIAAVACETKSQWPQRATVSPARSSSMEAPRKQWKFCRSTRNKTTFW